MIRKVIFLFLLAFFLFILSNQSLAQQNTVDVYLFYGQGCPHCAQAEEFLRSLEKKYTNLKIKEFEVSLNQENREIYFALATAYQIDLAQSPVPVIFIGNKSFIGYSNYIGSQIKNEIIKCSGQKCSSPIEKLSSNPSNQPSNPSINSKQTIIGWAVIILIILIVGFLIGKFFFKKRKN